MIAIGINQVKHYKINDLSYLYLCKGHTNLYTLSPGCVGVRGWSRGWSMRWIRGGVYEVE